LINQSVKACSINDHPLDLARIAVGNFKLQPGDDLSQVPVACSDSTCTASSPIPF
jgi:hypothetical protein